MGDGGKVTDIGDLVSDGFDFVGWHDAADTVDAATDNSADWLGVDVRERGLDETGDPRLLVHGDPAAIGTSGAHLRRLADAFGRTADGLRGLDVDHWSGTAGDAFRIAFTPQPAAWFAAADACSRAADALDGFAAVVGWAQGQAAEAVRLHRAGVATTDQARSTYADQVARYRRRVAGRDTRELIGLDPGPAPVTPADPGDPGLADRRHAQEVLDRARIQRNAAAVGAQQAVTTATATAPPKPSAGERTAGTIEALASVVNTQGNHVLGGLVKGATGLVRFVRRLDPIDPYNISHPAQYLDGVSTTVAGLQRAMVHPTELITGLVGTGWGSDPGEAFGRLAANVTADVVTGGAALTATSTARVAARSATRATAEEEAALARAALERHRTAVIRQGDEQAEARRAHNAELAEERRPPPLRAPTPEPPPVVEAPRLPAADAHTATEIANIEASMARVREALDGPRPDPTVTVPQHTTPTVAPVHATPTPPRTEVTPAPGPTDTSAITRALDAPAPPQPPTIKAAPRSGRSREGSWTSLARPTAGVREPAIHAGSTTSEEAAAYVRAEYPQLPQTNKSRLDQRLDPYMQNCTHCVVTVEQQLAGTWVQAAPRPVLGDSLRDLRDALPPGQLKRYSSYDGIIREMDAAGIGTRGFVYIARPGGTAHVFNTITTRDGVVFLDGQSGTLAQLESPTTSIALYIYRRPT